MMLTVKYKGNEKVLTLNVTFVLDQVNVIAIRFYSGIYIEKYWFRVGLG